MFTKYEKALFAVKRILLDKGYDLSKMPEIAVLEELVNENTLAMLKAQDEEYKQWEQTRSPKEGTQNA
jgi:hypothetical protein